MTNRDDLMDQKLSAEVDSVIKNPYKTLCVRSKVWPNNIKCFMPKVESNKTQCQKVFESLGLPNAWYYCTEEDGRLLLIVQQKQQ